jgi:LPPG:FO 2-phospho-L-lactate transferase
MILALAGGVGGAKLAQGLALALPPGDLTVVVNTGDDFDLFGLRICPDLDTVLYALAGLANPVTGWGIKDDTRATLDAIGRYGRDLWFQLGDQDFATHILRTERLRQGAPLSVVMAEFASALGVPTKIAPMTDDAVATLVQTPEGVLDFQTYFVGRRQQDEVVGLEFRGVATARPTQAALDAFDSAEMIVLCPSNPLVSIGPILAVPGFRERLAEATAPRIAVSPIVGGKALKGPADKMLVTLGHEVSSVGVARLYQGLIDGLVIDEQDRELKNEIESLGVRVLVTQSIMGGPDDRKRLALETLAFGRSLQRAGAATA